MKTLKVLILGNYIRINLRNFANKINPKTDFN